ncbi:MAG: Hsp20/alpha crystallin family protein [Gammaproteobacteria bacterium]|nr:Hsp20/alpha crystallin family protein [Gammaproteobacteria bacterium]MBU1441793.1 Hsp20/alpha crystallin family protein [Gammaproteobacteria bacterium]MBU2288030.1 Hsp20/alpha crystallin family protein [Gammaproteobacteria bacterium]MBU2409511.1 Hsp20/alpha crystallin family protein [Gammaproteobacteria bacterium]
MFFAPTIRTSRFVPRTYDRRFERLMNDAFSTTWRSRDIQEDEKTWTLTLDVPGLSRDDLHVEIEGAVVRVNSKAEAPRQFRAAYELPQEVDAAASEAKVENGVLTLRLAKQALASKAVQIKVE